MKRRRRKKVLQLNYLLFCDDQCFNKNVADHRCCGWTSGVDFINNQSWAPKPGAVNKSMNLGAILGKEILSCDLSSYMNL